MCCVLQRGIIQILYWTLSPFCGVNCIYMMFRKVGSFVLSGLITGPMIEMALSSGPKQTGNLSPPLHLMMGTDSLSETCTSSVPRKRTISNTIYRFNHCHRPLENPNIQFKICNDTVPVPQGIYRSW